MKILVSIAEKVPTHGAKGRKFAINVPLGTLQMGPKERKSVYCVHAVISPQSVHQPVSPALRVVSPRIHQAIASLVHRELTTL